METIKLPKKDYIKAERKKKRETPAQKKKHNELCDKLIKEYLDDRLTEN